MEQSLTVSGEEGAGPNGRGREEEEDVDSAVGLSFALDASRKKPAEAEVEQSGKHGRKAVCQLGHCVYLSYIQG